MKTQSEFLVEFFVILKTKKHLAFVKITSMRLTLLCILLFFVATAFSQQPPQVYNIDTSKIAILPATEYLLNPVQATITDDEIQLAEEIVDKAFEKMSGKFKRSECQSVSYLSLYKRQYFAVMENGQKIVYVNCFTDNNREFPLWKKHAAIIFGRGGSVHIKLNLNKKECTSFQVSRPCFSRLKILKPAISTTSL